MHSFKLFMKIIIASLIFSNCATKNSVTVKEYTVVPQSHPYNAEQVAVGNEIFKVVERMPRFPGCEDLRMSEIDKAKCASDKLEAFIYDNLQYPEMAKENDIEGTCLITFLVNKEGKLSDIRLVKDIGAGCGEEALRIVNLMPKQGVVWTAGRQRFTLVNVQYTLPIDFKLSKKRREKQRKNH